jgi:uncharacterized protein
MRYAAPVKNSNPQYEKTVSQLCPACALCCNGVLFADVELQRGDDSKWLSAAGMELARTGRKLRFLQPCSCLEGNDCRIYEKRPIQCRAFECRLLQRTQSGKTTVESALKTITATTRQAQNVRELLRRLGQTDESVPLSRRYAKLMAEPIDLSRGEEASELRGELMMAVHHLMEDLHREFLA